jgi:hypothetical protein
MGSLVLSGKDLRRALVPSKQAQRFLHYENAFRCFLPGESSTGMSKIRRALRGGGVFCPAR